jgi:two-component system cell cycle sensor histidine kinase/response regulator CckA
MRIFPFTKPTRKVAEAPPPPPEWRGEGRVIVVDDQDDVRNLVAHSVERLGFTVESACDGRGALSSFESDPCRVSLVIVDIVLPGMDGIELVRRLRLIRRDVPVVVISGYFGQETGDRLRAEPATGFLQKPFKPDALLSEMRGVLGR